jgi:hypothetical protein
VYWRLTEQDARRNAVKETRHDSLALETRRSFDPLTGRIDTLQSGSTTPSQSLQSWDLDFDLAGNLVRRRDPRSGFDETAYYDRLDRMTRVNLKGPGLPGQGTDTLAIAYDAIGNICQKTVAGVPWPLPIPVAPAAARVVRRAYPAAAQARVRTRCRLPSARPISTMPAATSYWFAREARPSCGRWTTTPTTCRPA